MIELSSSAADIARQLDAFPRSMAEAVARAMDYENQLTVGHIVSTKLTSAGPRFLNARTSRLRGSARATAAKVTGAGVESGIGSNVRYAGIHEFGFRGTVNVPGFTRKNPKGDTFSRNGVTLTRRQATAFFGKGGRARAGVIKSSSAISFVRAHTRKLNFPARAMFYTGITEREGNYSTSISSAIVNAWSTK
jgi:phage gpG-like protein